MSAKGGESVAECPSDSNVERFNISPLENLNYSNPSAAAGGSSVKFTSELRKGASSFRLLQDYASDDSSENVDEPCVEDVSPAAVSPSMKAGAKSSDVFLTNIGIKDLPELKKEFGPSYVSVVIGSLGISSKSLEPSTEAKGVERKTDKSIGSGKAEQLEDSPGSQEFLDAGTCHKAFQEKDYMGRGGVDAASESANFQKEEIKSNSNQLKVDEFGRLPRAGASDSDSDDLHYTRRRGKRGRSWSRSRSPHDRRRRSPLRRREKRSRSRSWSPKKRRSRSKSPLYRRGGEAGVDRSRRDRGQLPDCFDFLRGKCFRGASCRYFHDSDKVDGSRRHKSKQQYQDVSPRLKSSEKSVHQHDEINRQDMHLYQDAPGSSVGATKDVHVYQQAISVTTGTSDRRLPSEKGGESSVADVAEYEIAQGLTTQEQETRGIQEEPVEPANNLVETSSFLENISLATGADGKKLLGDSSQGTASFGHLMDQGCQANLSDPVLQSSDYQAEIEDSSTSVTARASTIPSQLPVNESQENQQSSLIQFETNQIPLIRSDPDTGPLSNAHSAEYMTSRELPPNIPAHLSQPHLPLPPISQGTNAPFPPRLPSDYDIMPSAAKYPSHSASGENFTPYQTPMPYQHSHFSAPVTSSWNFLPPPPPRPPHGVPFTQFPQNQLPPSSDYSSQAFARPYAAELPTHSQVGEFHHGRYPLVPEHDRCLSHTEDFRRRTFPINYSMTQQFGGSSLIGEDNTRLPVQGLISSNPFAPGNIHPPQIFSRESPTRRMQSLSGDILPPGELPIPSSESHLYLPPYGLQGPAADNISVNAGESGKINSRYSSEFLDRNPPSHLSDFGRSRISNHYNPYASTFDQPLSTKFSSNILTQEKDTSYSNKYSGLSSLSHVPVDGQGVGSLSSRIMTSAPNSARDAAQMLPRSGSDQYDPIFDSIEPSSSSFKRSDHGKKREATDNSDIMLRLSASNKPQDLVGNNTQKEAGAVALSTSAENDEFGETADAEVGAVENGSPSDPIDLVDLATGDIEIDQVKTPGKSKKKSKDSRSMKLFKVALADFVKEVLKPSWRQGNMSKEAFKTIVKKTVDKVSGAMKSHQVPKSQAKINHYIDSSQRKLTKLVMGYVDKYVKV